MCFPDLVATLPCWREDSVDDSAFCVSKEYLCLNLHINTARKCMGMETGRSWELPASQPTLNINKVSDVLFWPLHVNISHTRVHTHSHRLNSKHKGPCPSVCSN